MSRGIVQDLAADRPGKQAGRREGRYCNMPSKRRKSRSSHDTTPPFATPPQQGIITPQCVLLDLDHDALDLLAQRLSSPLQPKSCIHLLATCKMLHTSLHGRKLDLQRAHDSAWTLCDEMGMSCKELATTTMLAWTRKRVRNADIRVLSSILMSGSMAPLRSIRFDDGNVRDEGAVVLAGLIKGGALRNLRVLGLGNNQIADRGGTALARSIGSLRKVEQLQLRDNLIGDAGAASFEVAARNDELSQLTSLSLMSNRISPQGGKALKEAYRSARLAGKLVFLLDLNLVNQQHPDHISSDDDSEDYSDDYSVESLSDSVNEDDDDLDTSGSDGYLDHGDEDDADVGVLAAGGGNDAAEDSDSSESSDIENILIASVASSSSDDSGEEGEEIVIML